MPPHIVHYSMPEAGMGCAYLGLFFIEVMFFVFAYFRGVNHR